MPVRGYTGAPPAEPVAGRRAVPLPPVAAQLSLGLSCGPSTGWSARTPRSSVRAGPLIPSRRWPAAARVVFEPVRPARRRDPLERQSLGLAVATAHRPSLPIPRPCPRPPPRRRPATGIDYLGHHRRRHEQAARRHRIRYDALAVRAQDRQATASRTGSDRPSRCGPAEISDLNRLGRALPATAPASAIPAPPRSRYLGRKETLLDRIAAARDQDCWPATHPSRPPGGIRRRRRLLCPGRRHHRIGRTTYRPAQHYGFTRTPFGTTSPVHALHLLPTPRTPRPSRGFTCAPRARPRRQSPVSRSGKTISARAAHRRARPDPAPP